MVRKEDLCDWFKALSTRKRIDYMCGLLLMCLPQELRFLGTVLEDLAKKDFHFLRDQEIKANQPSDLSSNNSSTLADAQLRAKLLSALALLNSTNSSCAEIIFDILEHQLGNPSELVRSSRQIAEDINLILTMANHHPAFKFYQRTRLGEKLKTCVRHAQEVFGDEDDPDLSFPKPPVMQEPAGQPTSIGSSRSTASSQSEKATVQSIKIVAARPEPQNNRGGSEYQIHTTWSNGDVTEVFFKFKHLQELHRKILHKFPEERKDRKRQSVLPVFPGKHKHTNEGPEDQISSLNSYLSQLVKAPPHILDCEILTEPLKGGTLVHQANPAPSTAAPSIPMASNPPPAQLLPLRMQGSPSREERFYDSPSLIGFPLSHHPYPHMIAPSPNIYGSIHLASTTNSPAGSRTSSPAPHLSQAGSRSYFIPSTGVKVISPNPQELQQLLNVLNLQQYYDNLKEFSVKQMVSMSKDDFAKAGLPPDAQVKLRSKLDQYKTSPPDANGVDYPVGGMPVEAIAPAIYHIPAVYYPMPYPNIPFPAPTNPISLQPSPHPLVPAGESSPVQSETSSPPTSPSLQQVGVLSIEHAQPLQGGQVAQNTGGPPLTMMSPPAAVAAESLAVSDVKSLKKTRVPQFDSSGSEEDKTAAGHIFEPGKGHGRAQHSQSLPHLNPGQAAVSALDEAKTPLMSAPTANHPAVASSDSRPDGTPPPHSLPVPMAAPPGHHSPGAMVNGYISDPPPIPPQGVLPSVRPRTMLSPRPFKPAQPAHTGPGIHKNIIPAFDVSHPPHNLVKNGGGGGVAPIIHNSVAIPSYMQPISSTISSTQVMGVSPAGLQANNALHLGTQPPPPQSLVNEGGQMIPIHILPPQHLASRGILNTIANSTTIMTTTQSHSVMPPLSHSPSPVGAHNTDPAAPFIAEADANRPDGPSLTPPSHTPPIINAFKSQTNTSGPNSGTPSPPLVSLGPKQPLMPYMLLPQPSNGYLHHFYSHPQQGHHCHQQHFPNGLSSEIIAVNRLPMPFLYGNSVYPPHNPANITSAVPTCVAGTAPAANHQNHSSTGVNSKSVCYNCGQAGHKGAECKENTMENMSNTFRLNINKPKSDSE